MTDDEQKIKVAHEVIAMSPFGWHQSWSEHRKAEILGTNRVTVLLVNGQRTYRAAT